MLETMGIMEILVIMKILEIIAVLEIMAILTEILEAGYVHADVGSAQEMYIWPYFARYPLARLSPEQKVEMYRIVTSGDYADMAITGTWTFYRVGIGPDGTLHYFVAGE